MEKKIIHILVFIGVMITFIIPLVQLLIGFHYVVHDGQSASKECAIAPDLPLLMAIGGIFALFFLGIAYGFLKMLSSIHIQQSDIAGRIPRLLVGLVSFIFGSITLIFFILIQIRVYGAYAKHIQYDTRSILTSCQPALMHSALFSIIFTYVNFLLFIGVYILVLLHAYCHRYQEHDKELEMKDTTF